MPKIRRDAKLSSRREIKDPGFRPGDHYFTETKLQNDHSGVAASAPWKVWGIVDPRGTKGRQSPPVIDIFATENSFFDKGHLLALELGGSDDQSNLIPQFREQNQRGEWKRLENQLRERAKAAWKDHGHYTCMQVEVRYDPGGGLVPTRLEVTVYELHKSHYCANPDDVQQWCAAPPAQRQNITNHPIDNKLTDQDLINTGLKKVADDDASNWSDYMLGKELNRIEQAPHLGSDAKEALETSALTVLFETGGERLNASQKKEVDRAKATYKAATKRTLVSEDKRKALEDREAFESGASSTVPGHGRDWSLEDFRDHFGKGRKEPVRRRSSSPGPSTSKKRKLEELKIVIDEAIPASKRPKLKDT